MEPLNLKKLLNQFFRLKKNFFIALWNNLPTDLYRHFLKFKENVPTSMEEQLTNLF